MMINHSVQSYAYSTPRTLRHRNATLKVEFFPGGRQLWLALVKMTVLLVPVILGVNMWVQGSMARLDGKAEQLAAQERQLREDNIILRTERAVLISPARFEQKAASKLALYFPDKGQVVRF
ncbi:MAG: hypothetical protein ABFS19_01875 [Thermodesulfobacteriota bacterium]